MKCGLKQLGEWGAVEVALLAPLILPVDVVWDAGAFVGTFSLGLSHHSPFAKLLALEANPELGAPLSANIESLMPDVQTRVLSVGVGPRKGVLRLQRETYDESNHGASSYKYTRKASVSGVVEARSLRDLRKHEGDYTVIKLDLEGMEAQTLKADRSYIRKTSPMIWAECNESLQSFALYKGGMSFGYACSARSPTRS